MSNSAFWISVVIVGAVLGSLLTPRVIAIVGACVLALCLLGLVVAGLTGAETQTWLFGMALMALAPAVGVALGTGTIVHAVLRRKPPVATKPSAKLRRVARGTETQEALKQFQAGATIDIGCPFCMQVLEVSHAKRSNVFVVACQCNRCRNDFPAPENDG